MAKIIKGDGSAVAVHESTGTGNGAPRRLIDAEVYDAGRQAKAIIAEAQAKAEQILQEAKAKRDQVLAQAVEQGRQQGLAKVTELLVKAGTLRDAKMAELEKQLVQLAVKLCEKILGREIVLDPKSVVDIAAQALQTARQQKEISLRVNPADAAIIRADQRRLIDLLSRAKHIEVREDESVARGGVVVETEVGIIDARLETQLEMLSELLEEASQS